MQPSSHDTSLDVSVAGTSGRTVSTDLRHQDKAGRWGSSAGGSANGAALVDVAPAFLHAPGGDAPLEVVTITSEPSAVSVYSSGTVDVKRPHPKPIVGVYIGDDGPLLAAMALRIDRVARQRPDRSSDHASSVESESGVGDDPDQEDSLHDSAAVCC